MKNCIFKNDKLVARPIQESDFTILEASDSPYVKGLATNGKKWQEAGIINLELTYVFEVGNSLVGGVIFLEETTEALQILDFAIDVIGEASRPLFLSAIAQVKRPETKEIFYNLYADTKQYNDIRKVFADVGFTVAQTKAAYALNVDKADDVKQSAYICTKSNTDDVLTYKDITEVGEEAYVDAIRDVTLHTLDSLMLEEANEKGKQRAAKEHFEALKEIEFTPKHWLLGYHGDEWVGLIIAQKFTETIGSINYIGVPPAHRGKGYGKYMLAKGTAVLLEEGVTQILADIDVANEPLAQIMKEQGYQYQMEEVVLRYHV